MSKLEWITIPDILDMGVCFISGHDWGAGGVCKNCGAKR